MRISEIPRLRPSPSSRKCSRRRRKPAIRTKLSPTVSSSWIAVRPHLLRPEAYLEMGTESILRQTETGADKNHRLHPTPHNLRNFSRCETRASLDMYTCNQ